MKKAALIFIALLFLFIPREAIAAIVPEIVFEPTFRANWAHIDRPEVYDYAATAMDDGQWKVWSCGEKSLGAGQDAVFFTSFNQEGQYDIPTTRVLTPQDDISSIESLHICAPSVVKHKTSLIENSKEYFKIYYECAPKMFDKNNPNVWQDALFAQICHAVSEDGINWKKWNEQLWDNQFRYGDENTEPSPVRKVAQQVIDNCEYEFKDGKHQANLDKCIDINNYGVGHPSAVVIDVNGNEPDGEQIWLFYYDSKGEWSKRGVYLAKSWDGFHFETSVRTNLKNPIDVKYFNLQMGDHPGVFIGTMGMEGDNYFAYSFDGVNWEWPNFADNPGGNYDHLKIGTAVSEHCAAPAQAAIIADKHGVSNSWFVNILSGEGFLGAGDGGQELGCYDPKEDESRGSTWGLYLVQGLFKEKVVTPGDANGDGKVDGLDYIIWLNNYNQTTPNGSSDGDFNNSGKVDGLDYVIWLNNYSS